MSDAREVGQDNARDARDAVLLWCVHPETGAVYLEEAEDHDVRGLLLPPIGRIGVDDEEGSERAAKICARRLAEEYGLGGAELVAGPVEVMGHGGQGGARYHVFEVRGVAEDGAGGWWETSALKEAWARGEVLSFGELVDEGVGGSYCWQPRLRWLPLETETLPPATHTNCYLLGPRESLNVVDPGSRREGGQRRLEEAIGALGGRVERVVLTHHHADHVGGVEAVLKRWPEAELCGHGETLSRLGKDLLSRARVRELTEGEVVGGFEVVCTPGHAPGHVALWEPVVRGLVCGDLMAAVGTIVVSPPEGNMADYFRSLKRARGLEPRVVYPSHGSPILEPRAHIDAYLAHRTQREQQIMAAMGEGWVVARDIVRVVYASIPMHVWPLAERNVVAHLEKLLEEERVVFEQERWQRVE